MAIRALSYPYFTTQHHHVTPSFTHSIAVRFFRFTITFLTIF
jgi:hypothetical protein